MAASKWTLLLLPLFMVAFCIIHCCHGNLKPHVLSKRHRPSASPVTYDDQSKSGLQHNSQDSDESSILHDAQEEQGYYLQQLFLHYGENGTLSFRGLNNLLRSLGLGQVQVVEIQHEDLGHGHVSHLDILDVQGRKHVHSHSSLEHALSAANGHGANTTSSPAEMKPSTEVFKKQTPEQPKTKNIVSTITPTMAKMDAANDGDLWLPRSRPEATVQVSQRWTGRDVLEKLILLDHSTYNHLHEDCLNVTQLLLNFGLGSAEELTPQEFTLICPALLYQIDSRVCIQHHDDVQQIHQKDNLQQMAVLGFGFLAITIISVPSLLAIVLVPFMNRSLFHFLLAFLVALAVGTLCGDALLHLLPHAHGHHKAPSRMKGPSDEVLKGLSVLSGIYVLFLIENTLALARQRKKNKSPKKKCSGTPQEPMVVLRVITSAGATESLTHTDTEACNSKEEHHCSLLSPPAEGQEKTEARMSPHTSVEDRRQHSGHSHGPQISGAAGIADIAWMVLLGDGIHNFTDGLAIGAAFSQGIHSGLSTSVAVFCHELPHELGDFAVLLQAGMPVKKVMLFSLLSAFLGYVGMCVGAVVSQSSSKVTPWIFGVTAGIFLYVALVDMLPDMLHRDPRRTGQTKTFLLRNTGFLLGAGLMLCIALFEDQIEFSHMDL